MKKKYGVQYSPPYIFQQVFDAGYVCRGTDVVALVIYPQLSRRRLFAIYLAEYGAIDLGAKSFQHWLYLLRRVAFGRVHEHNNGITGRNDLVNVTGEEGAHLAGRTYVLEDDRSLFINKRPEYNEAHQYKRNDPDCVRSPHVVVFF